MKPWVSITVAGTTAGCIVGALTYTATMQTTELLATTTGLGISAIGTFGSYVVSALMGDMAGISVRIASQLTGRFTEETVRSGGRTTAAIVSATTGALTALSISVGTQVIQYSIEYGGMLTEELAKRIAEEYFRFRFAQDSYQAGWVIVDVDEEPNEDIYKEPGADMELSQNKVY